MMSDTPKDDSIVIEESLTPYVFYYKLLPKVSEYFLKKTDKDWKIYIDMRNVPFISPLVLPNLFILGKYIANYYNEPPELYFGVNTRLVKYLYDMDFYVELDKYERKYKKPLFSINFFNLNHCVGLSVEKKLSSKCYFFSVEKISQEVKSKVEESKEILYYKYISKHFSTFTRNFGMDSSLPLLYTLKEFCHNGAFHSDSECYATFQVNKSKRFYFSVSDYGRGFAETIEEKINSGYEYKFLDISKPNYTRSERNVSAILEAIFYRFDDQYKGIYDMFCILIPAGGVIRIHTDNTQLVFTDHSFGNFLKHIDHSRRYFKKILDNFMYRINLDKEKKYSCTRVSENFKLDGAHIEIEIPIKGDTNDSLL